MSLDPYQPEEGVWRDPISAEEPDRPATFAVVIGVSRYDYFPGQLAVSATSALTFFHWLMDEYYFPESPLAQCWLLLSPCENETNFDRSLWDGIQFAEATFENCERAISRWYGQVRRLSRQVAEGSRTFFFFSGHGISVTRDRQILLPCDYLADPNQLNRAMSTENLWAAMEDTDVPVQFFFADGCREGHPLVQHHDIKGYPILPELIRIGANAQQKPARNAPLFYSCAPGTQAFQRRDPAQGLSLFSQALLEGLRGGAEVTVDNNSGALTLGVDDLGNFLYDRVMQLVSEAPGELRQEAVRAGQTAGRVTVTHLPI